MASWDQHERYVQQSNTQWIKKGLKIEKLHANPFNKVGFQPTNREKQTHSTLDTQELR